MAGMTHANDVRIAEGIRDLDLPADTALAQATWRTALNDAVVRWYRAAGCDIPDLNDLDRRGINEAINFCFPHYFMLPTFSQRVVISDSTAGPGRDALRIVVAHPLSSWP